MTNPIVADTRKFLEIIARHSARMERLVSDLLRLARLDARQEALDLASCDMQQLFNTVVGDVALTVESKRQHITTAVDPAAGRITADPAKLHDVLRNLVENAVHYSPEAAAIRLERRTRREVRISVSDSRPRHSADDLSRVFERFYRVDKSRSRPGGTGLGLAIVKHLIELHGGQALAENKPDGGARFVITLPDQR